ncbi:hypothetical protein B296_00002153 [Ensete ventricosum]|uniref:Uncharacterized protein n=1 Tax=Ensete ventricosum TaxID=4639 RepID=A0A427B2N6_ENSVE|nr:hypothetical protein B296_00002153 [Ensete ventricosum]
MRHCSPAVAAAPQRIPSLRFHATVVERRHVRVTPREEAECNSHRNGHIGKRRYDFHHSQRSESNPAFLSVRSTSGGHPSSSRHIPGNPTLAASFFYISLLRFVSGLVSGIMEVAEISGGASEAPLATEESARASLWDVHGSVLGSSR